ncbi:MAG: hypothetical protein IJZ35_04600 [Clostridia bacterium]|nr:hypothetical protein [Clostridia bacterium]
MKRLICAIAIIAISCTASILGSSYVNTTLDEITFIAENELDKLTEVWHQKREMLSVLLKNSDIDSIEEQIYGECDTAELTAVIKSIKDGEKFTIGNIF